MNIGIANTIAIAKFAIFKNFSLSIITFLYELTNCFISVITGRRESFSHSLYFLFESFVRNKAISKKGIATSVSIIAITYPCKVFIIFIVFIFFRLYTFCYFHKHFSFYYLVGFDKAKGAHKTFLVLDVVKG